MERAVEATDAPITVQGTPAPGAEILPTDKLVDISPLALRMSSPFNPGYWLSAS